MSEDSNPYRQIIKRLDDLVKSRFIEIKNQERSINKIGDFIHPYNQLVSFDDSFPILSITKENGIVFQSDKFKKRIASKDVSNYKVVPRGIIVQGIHIDERNFGVQDLTDFGLVSPAYKLWEPDLDLCNPYVIAYALRTDEVMEQIRSKFRGSIKRRENITVEDFLKIRLDIPSLDVQNQFADFVKQVDKSKFIAHQAAEKYDQLVKSRFIEMFGDHTQLSRWPCCPVSEVCNVKVGVVIKPAQYYTSKDEGIKTFRSLNIGENKIIDKEWVYFSKEGNEANKRTILHKDDVIIARSGSPGVACVITDEYEGCNAVDVIIATPNTSKVNPDYLAFFTNFPHGKQQIIARGAAQQHFNVSAYEKVTLAIPSIELQNAFVKFAKQVDKSKFNTS